MKSIGIAELKANLSRYLRRVRKGERFLVLDRSEAVAELGPTAASVAGAYDRLVREGAIRPAVRSWGSVRISEPSRRIDVQALLDEVRQDVV